MLNGGTRSHYKKKHCSPFKKRLAYSCFSHKILLRIAKALNKIAKSLNTVGDIQIKPKGLDDKQLYHTMCDVIQTRFNCKTEACWLQIRALMNDLSEEEVDYFRRYLRPKMPKEVVKDYTEWISNFDIETVLDQYDKDLSDFSFYGAVPIDFRKCSVSKLCKMDLGKHMKKGENKLGIVFNTDESDEPGKHWISMYVDIMGKNLGGQPGIYFFDSFGSRPMKEVKDLITRIQKQGKKHKVKFIVSHNDKVFQNNSFSCGFYCMHFIEHMLKGLSFNKYLKSGLSDKRMIEYQRHCYLHPEEIKN